MGVGQGVDVGGKGLGVGHQEFDHGDCLIRAKRLLELVPLGHAQGLAIARLEFVEDGQHRQHVARGVGELHAERLLGTAHPGQKRLELGPGLAAPHGGLQLTQHGELLVHRHPGRRGVGTDGPKGIGHALTGSLEQLHRERRLAGHIFHPVGLAHLLGLLLEDAVHGAHVVGDGGGVGFCGLGQGSGGASEGWQLVTLQPGDGGLDVVGGADNLGGRVAILHGQLEGFPAKRVEHILLHIEGGHLGEGPVHLDGRAKGALDCHDAARHGRGPHGHIAPALTARLADLVHLGIDAGKGLGDLVNQGHLHHQFFHPGHQLLPVQCFGNALGHGGGVGLSVLFV
ncbi:hypothetical protein D3C71_1366580 [compost metagenome]